MAHKFKYGYKYIISNPNRLPQLPVCVIDNNQQRADRKIVLLMSDMMFSNMSFRCKVIL